MNPLRILAVLSLILAGLALESCGRRGELSPPAFVQVSFERPA